MSFEESILARVARAANSVGLEAILIGNAAAALHGVPVTTQDIDLFVRDTPRNAEKLSRLIAELGDRVIASRPFEPASRMIRIEGLPVDVDLVFELSSRAKFESVRARSVCLTIEDVAVRVACLEDIIDAKRAAGRPKDHATLPLLEEFLRVRNAVNDNASENESA